MEFTLEVDSITKYFGNKLILSDVYLKCSLGDIIGIFGRNGSGKSTLMKIIYGTLYAENKYVKLNQTVSQKPYTVPNGISLLPQNNYLPSHFNVKKAINLSIESKNLHHFYDDELLSKLLNSKIHELSGGERHYLEVKILLFNNSKFCLLDEPYSGISPILKDKINLLILEQSKNKGIIIADHSYSYLLDVATKFFLIKNGIGKFINSKQELISNGYLTESMLST